MSFNQGANNIYKAVNQFNNNDDGLFTWSRKPVYTFQKGITRWTEYNDPTYLGFVIMFDWVNSPLLNISEDPGTAYSYLIRNGEVLRASYLQQFVECLKAINYNMPWYWQSIEGLASAWKYDSFKEPYKGGDDSVLDIECLESIDLKMTLLVDLYRKAIYDNEHKRVILPENLRKFEMYIYVQEVRKFQIDKYLEMQNKIAAVNVPGVNNKVPTADTTIINRNENSPYVMFLFKFCEFDPDAASETFSTISMIHGDSGGFAKSKMSIKYELVEEPMNFYPLINATISTLAPNVPANNGIQVNKFEDAPEDDLRTAAVKLGQASAKRLADNAAAEASSLIGAKIQGLVLGNVYGALNDVRNALQQGSIQSLGPGLINSFKDNKPKPQKDADLGNAYE